MNIFYKVIGCLGIIVLAILITIFSRYIPFTFTFKTITYTESAPMPIPCPTETSEKNNENTEVINLIPLWRPFEYAPVGLPFSYTETKTTTNCGFSDLRNFTIKDLIQSPFWFLINTLFWSVILIKLKIVIFK